MFYSNLLKSLTLILAASVYCATLPKHYDPLATTISDATRKAVIAANDDGDDSVPTAPCDFSMFLDDGYVPKVRPPARLLEQDFKTLESAQFTVDWMTGGAKKCRKTLKTAAAKTTLAAIITACRMDDLSKIERVLNKWSLKMPKKYPEGAVDCSIHEWMEAAHHESLGILEQYLASGVLLGKAYEQADAAALCAYVRDISCVYYDFHEDSLYYGWLRNVAAQHYDLKVNKNDIKACFDALKVVDGFVAKNSETADDLDSIVSAAAAAEVVYDFRAGLTIVHVDRNKFGAAQVNSSRLRDFLDTAPQIFSFCAANSLSDVAAELLNQQWAFWQQANQTIWVDRKGITSVRIKANGQITVGFLRSNPYYANGLLDRNFLGDRTTEELKLTEAYGANYLVAIPASAPNQPFTPYWHSGQQQPNYQQLQLMARVHIIK